MRSAWLRGLLFAALALLPARRARAGDCRPINGVSPCIDADNLWPHAGGGPYFALGDPTTTPAGSLSVGLVGSFASKPIGVRVASADPAGSTVFLVDGLFDVTLLFALGVTDRLEVTLAAPATLYQSGAGLAQVDGNASPQLRSAPRDVRFGFAFSLLPRPRGQDGPALAGRLEFDTPTGSDDQFAHGSTAVVIPSLSFSYRIGRVDVAAEAAGRLRGEAVIGNAVVGTQVGVALGASVDILRAGWLSAGGEAFALPAVSLQRVDPQTMVTSPLCPAEWIAHASTAHLMGGDLVISLGGGGSIPSGSHTSVTSPRYRLDFAVRFAPKAPQGANRPR